MRYLITILATFLLASCSMHDPNHFSDTVTSWKGANVQKLFSTWGAPDRVMQTAHGNTIYVYTTTSYRVSYAPTEPQVGVNIAGGRPVIVTSRPSNAIGRGGFTYECTTLFETNKQDIITHIRYQGNGCYGSDNFANSRTRR